MRSSMQLGVYFFIMPLPAVCIEYIHAQVGTSYAEAVPMTQTILPSFPAEHPSHTSVFWTYTRTDAKQMETEGDKF